MRKGASIRYAGREVGSSLARSWNILHQPPTDNSCSCERAAHKHDAARRAPARGPYRSESSSTLPFANTLSRLLWHPNRRKEHAFFKDPAVGESHYNIGHTVGQYGTAALCRKTRQAQALTAQLLHSYHHYYN